MMIYLTTPGNIQVDIEHVFKSQAVPGIQRAKDLANGGCYRPLVAEARYDLLTAAINHERRIKIMQGMERDELR
jgi:hypothetical protein